MAAPTKKTAPAVLPMMPVPAPTGTEFEEGGKPAPTSTEPVEMKTGSKYEMVKTVVEKMGKDAKTADVAEKVKESNPDEKWSDSTLGQYVTKARKELGFSAARATGGTSATVRKAALPGTPVRQHGVTLDDMLAAKELMGRLNMTKEELLQLVADVQEFGDLEALRDALEGLAKLTGGK